jgi:hypothetical protein
MTKERLPYAHVSPLWSPGRLQPIPEQRFPVGFFGENAKFWVVALPWVISGTGVSHLLMSLTG